MTLGNRHLAYIAEGACDEAATLGGETAELLHGTADLLPLRWRELLHDLGPGKQALALLGRHRIQLRKPVPHTLLCLCGKVLKSGFMLQGALLLLQWEIAMAIHPLRQVFLLRL